MTKKKNAIPENGIYDARTLGVPKMLILGLQHMFAMFGATVPRRCCLQVSARSSSTWSQAAKSPHSSVRPSRSSAATLPSPVLPGRQAMRP